MYLIYIRIYTYIFRYKQSILIALKSKLLLSYLRLQSLLQSLQPLATCCNQMKPAKWVADDDSRRRSDSLRRSFEPFAPTTRIVVAEKAAVKHIQVKTRREARSNTIFEYICMYTKVYRKCDDVWCGSCLSLHKNGMKRAGTKADLATGPSTLASE